MPRARAAKKDEFYTLLADIEAELVWYKQHFKDKVVYCNCDDAYTSNFVKFFQDRFEEYGLKELIASSYSDGDITTQIYRKTAQGVRLTTDLGDGSYSSPACLRLLGEADIVVTNPPFSLFRDYITTLVQAKKQFLVIGNNNAITYKELFPLIRSNQIWLGIHVNKTLEFRLDPSYSEWSRMDDQGNKYGKVPAISWFTNLGHHKRNTAMTLHKRYTKDAYPQYDNYDAINVSKVKDIPKDYYGAMGVPITYLDKHCPHQFTIEDANDYILGQAAPLKPHGLIKDSHSAIGGKPVYARIVIRRVKSPGTTLTKQAH